MKGVSLLEIFITYLAVGSAFAMRAYFLNRRRSVWIRFREITGQFLLWLPILLVRLVSRRGQTRGTARSASGANDAELESRINRLISCFPNRHQRNQARQVLERYAALHSALKCEGSQAAGQFELFAIAGNGNGSTGTPCLYRKNLSKLMKHKLRTTENLVALALQEPAFSSTSLVVSELIAFFDAFDDRLALEKLKVLNVDERAGNSTTVRMAA